MKRTAVTLIFISIISKMLGFLREIILSYFYGASNISDAYLVSLTIPLTIFSFIGVGLSTNFIPLYSEIIKKKDSKLANNFANNVINMTVIICFILIFLSLCFAEQLVKIFASGFSDETLNLAVNFTRISIWGIIFSAITYIFIGYIQLKNNFIVPALIGIPFNFISITAIFLSFKYNIYLLSIGYVIAIFFQLVLLIPFAYKKGYNYEWFIDKSDVYLKKMFFLAIPIIVGVSVNQINVLIDRTIASRLAVGGISALTYANRLNWFVQGIFVTSITVVMYPKVSKMASENNISELKKSLVEAICLINLLVLPITIGSMLFAEPIVKFLFGRGAFDVQAIYLTSYALFFYSIGMIGFGLREVLSKAFYSLQDTKTPMINATVAMIMNIILNILLSKFLGIGGLALATSVSAIFCTLLLFISLRKKIGPFGLKNILVSFLKILWSSLVMGVVAQVSYNILLSCINNNLSLIFSVGIGAATYLIIIYFMKIKEFNVVVNVVKKQIKKCV